MKLLPEVAQRQRFADEIHARPFESAATPGAVLSVATQRRGADEDAHPLG